MSKYLALIITLVFLSVPFIADAADKKVIIGFKKGITVSEEKRRQKFSRSRGHIKRTHKLINAISGQVPEEEIDKIKNDPDVAYVEPDVEVGITDPGLVLPPLTQEYKDSWGVTRIGGNAAVAAGITGAGIKVAILDSGIDYNHPDLKDNYKGGYNFAYDNDDPYDDGYISHGTHIAGIIGARNNGTGVVGVAPEVSLYAVKVLGGMVMGDLSDILAGMEWAISNNMNIINLSIGAPIDSEAFKDVCDRAYQAGIIVVAASGNTHSNLIEVPAVYDSVIAVSATNQDDTFATFSNYGEKIELAAPGVNILSTLRGGGYGVLQGTSQATAHVTGAAAILLAKKLASGNGTGLLAEDVRQLLDSSALDLGDSGRDQYFGYGLVDLAKALTPPPPTEWRYSITRGHCSPLSQILKAPLDEGDYQVAIELSGMLELKVLVKDANGTRRITLPPDRRWAHKKHGRHKGDTTTATFTVSIASAGTLIFIPEGKPGSSADILITAN